ncbi:hypothetical protein OKW36_001793 [Paraburkholderia sp. MM5482-R1]
MSAVRCTVTRLLPRWGSLGFTTILTSPPICVNPLDHVFETNAHDTFALGQARPDAPGFPLTDSRQHDALMHKVFVSRGLQSLQCMVVTSQTREHAREQRKLGATYYVQGVHDSRSRKESFDRIAYRFGILIAGFHENLPRAYTEIKRLFRAAGWLARKLACCAPRRPSRSRNPGPVLSEREDFRSSA